MRPLGRRSSRIYGPERRGPLLLRADDDKHLTAPRRIVRPTDGASALCQAIGVKRIAIAVGAVALVAVVVIGLSQAGGGGKQEKSAGGACGTVPARLEGAPPPLADLHEQGCDLLDGGPTAFKERLAALKGHPVVVNKWASWCGPCRAEFPHFQKASVALGKRVAFLGVDSNDNYDDAAKFLDQYPVSYPSYKDGSNTIAQVFNGVVAFPTTVFYDAKGKMTYIHNGQYPNEAALRRDIRRYAGA
jgi:cytochrome c biogenesis protein CcmG/thiol:disulfide interchange protein DsbE